VRNRADIISMTTPHGDPEAFWNNLLEKLEQFVEADQDAPRVNPWDKDPDYIWKPPWPDRDGGGSGLPENGGLG